MDLTTKTFAERLIDWQQTHGRHNLPWQSTRDPYRVWLSEIMLQQTQVDTVIPYYLRFLKSFPTVAALASASNEIVLAHWSGLGYYARARNLHRAAQIVMQDHGGMFPANSEALTELPGIGRSTAAAIASFCFGERAAILDGNVKRVLTRQFGVDGFPGERAIEQGLWRLADSLLPATGVDIYTQALMDLGATVCTRSKPLCLHCPVAETCIARREGRQAELPTARPKRTIPLRDAEVLLLTAGETVLLEQRPSSGIWGGLYSLPELVGGETPQALAARRFGLGDIGECLALPAVKHSFTHFTLTITPWLATLVEQPKTAQTPGLIWASLTELDRLGLPAPIRRLLDKVEIA